MINLKVLIFTSLVGLTAFSASLDAKAIYKWKDEKGNVQYSQTKPPKGVEYTVLNYRQEKGTVVSGEKKSSQAQVSEEDKVLAKQAAQQQQINSQQDELNRKNCQISQNNLKVLENQTRIQVEENGEKRLLTDKERADKLKEAQDNVAKFCKK